MIIIFVLHMHNQRTNAAQGGRTPNAHSRTRTRTRTRTHSLVAKCVQEKGVVESMHQKDASDVDNARRETQPWAPLTGMPTPRCHVVRHASFAKPTLTCDGTSLPAHARARTPTAHSGVLSERAHFIHTTLLGQPSDFDSRGGK